MIDLSNSLQQLSIALGLGLLVGLPQEHVAFRFAGLRNFPMATFFGTICAMLGQSFGGWPVAMGLVALARIIIVGNIAKLKPKVLRTHIRNLRLTTQQILY